MTREDLVKELSDKTHFTLDNSAIAVSAFMDILTNCVKSHENITFHGLFTLQPVIKAPRKCKNPQTGEPIFVPAKRGYKFLLSPKLKNFLQQDQE